MVRIVTENVDAYVKKLLSDEFGSDANEDNRSQSNMHSVDISVPAENTNLASLIPAFDDAFKHIHRC